MRAVKRRPKFPDLSAVSGASSQFIVVFLGSSTTEGYRASNENANYVNQFAAKLVESAMDSISKRQVWVWQRPVPAPGDETIGTGTGWNPSKATIAPYSPGLFFFNAGMSGKNSGSDTNGYYQSGKQQQVISNLQPNVVIHMIGANDFKDQVPLDTYLANLQFAVNDIRAKTGGKARHLFIHSYQRLDYTPPNGGYQWSGYLSKIRELCNTNLDCNYIEITSDFANLGVVPGASYPNDYVQDDGVHATDLGYQKTAEFIVAKTRMLSYRARVIFGFAADDCGTNGTAVASVPSTPGLNALEPKSAVQTTAAKQPTVVTNALNGHSVLQFDGSSTAAQSDHLDLDLTRSYGEPLTFIFVIKQYGAAGSADGSFISRTNSDHFGYVYCWGRYQSGQTLLVDLTFLSNAGTNQASNPLTIRSDTPYVIGVVMKAGIMSDVYLHALNPVRQGYTTIDATNAPIITSLRIGSNTGQTNSANMQLAEFLAIQGELTKAEMNSRMQALATKYGLTLNANYAPPLVGQAYYDPFDSTSAPFTRTQNGSGITISGGQAQWGGGSDGQGIARYNSVSDGSNQYAACIVGSTNNAQYSGLVLQCPATPGTYYGLAFKQDTIQLIRATGRWRQTVNNTYTTASVYITSGDKIEFWNKGEKFYATVNGYPVFIEGDFYTISGATMTASTKYQGFGLMRASFNSSTPITDWWGGDATAYGK